MIKMKTRLFITIISSLIFFNIMAQDNNGMYFMPLIPQSNYLNPAIRPSCNLYFGAPVLASSYFEFNSALSFNDLMYKDDESDSVVTFLASKTYQDKFINKLDNAKNLFGIENQLSVLSFGFKVGDKLFLNFDLISKTKANMNIPSDFAGMFLKGNFNPETEEFYDYNLSNFDINFTSYAELSIGASYQINDQISVGIRPKFIHGIANLSSSKQDVNLISTDTSINFGANFTVNSNIPGLEMAYNNEGLIDSMYFSQDNLASQINGNTGFGIDIGGIYKFDDKITAYASIVDLGFIKWKSNPNSMTFNADYNFEGVDMSGFLADQEENPDDTGNAFLDTLRSAFDISNNTTAYRTGLGTKIFLGGTYAVHEKIELGLLSRSEIYRRKFRQQVTFSANFKPFKSINATISYTLKNYTFNNLGYGLAYRFGPSNTYVVIDKSLAAAYLVRDKIMLGDIDFAIPIPHKFSNYTIRFGINLVFGGREKKNKKVDQPIVD